MAERQRRRRPATQVARPAPGGAAARGATAEPPPAAAELLRAARRALASLRAATETLQAFPQAAEAVRARLLAVVAEETERLTATTRALDAALAASARRQARRTVATPGEVAVRLAGALARSGLECATDAAAPAGGAFEVDLEGLAQATEELFASLRRHCPVGACRLSHELAEHHLLLDVRFEPDARDLDRLLAWQGEALGDDGAEGTGRLRALVREHEGEAWFALDRDGGAAHLRVLLPASPPR